MAGGSPKSIPDRLLAALKKLDRPGRFCASGAVPTVLPGLEVEGVGAISLPLPANQADALKRVAEQAGYGKGEKTIVDTKVRRVWKLKPEQFSLSNPAWSAAVDDIVAKVQRELGLEKQKLHAHLYDLLLYEKGSFFLPHRDGEKLDRMVATLVVVLPSSYTGGELLVRHEGIEQIIDSSEPAGKFQIQYAAFYADCEHEVKPLLSGYRLCLVYNLTLAESKAPIGAPKTEEHVSHLAEILRDWTEQPDAPDKLAVALTHQYTKDGLAWDALKGADRAWALALAEAARRSQCHAYLALAVLWESGSLPYDGEYESGYGRRRAYRMREEKRPRVMEEVFDSSLTAEHFQSPDGEPMPLENLTIEPEQIVPEGYLRTVDPEEAAEGYTGNEGLTLERWYRQAVIMLWPHARHFDVLCDNDSRKAVPLLQQMVTALRKSNAASPDTRLERPRQLARRILQRWPECKHGRHFDDLAPSNAPDPISALLPLDDADLIHLYLRHVVARDALVEPHGDFAKALWKQGWRAMRTDLLAVFKKTASESLERNGRLLERLCQAAAKHKATQERDQALEVCRAAADHLISALETIDAPTAAEDYHFRGVNRGKLAACIARGALIIDSEHALSRLVAQICSQPKRYPLHQMQLIALSELAKWFSARPSQHSASLASWVDRCTAELKSLTLQTPKPPADYQREANVSCKCKECNELNAFLRDPKAAEHRFRVAQQFRTHIENSIRHNKCDVDCTTDTKPRPQILICTKNTESFKRKLKAYHENLTHLEGLRSFAGKVS